MHRYKYTCPDVIHMRKVRRNTAIAYAVGYAALCGVAWLWTLGVNEKTDDIPDTNDEI